MLRDRWYWVRAEVGRADRRVGDARVQRPSRLAEGAKVRAYVYEGEN